MALFEYFKLFEYCQKLLILYQSHCLIQFSIVQDCAPSSIDFARATCVRFVTHNEFDFTRLNQDSSAMAERPRKVGDFKGSVTHFEGKF